MNEKKDDLIRKLLDEMSKLPFHRFLGLNVESFNIENGSIHFDMRDEFVGNPDYSILHGGVIATIFDIEGAFLLFLNGDWRRSAATAASPKLKGGTINLHVDYLRPGKGKHFVVSGTVLHGGKKVAVVHTELRNENDELIAAGTGTYLIG